MASKLSRTGRKSFGIGNTRNRQNRSLNRPSPSNILHVRIEEVTCHGSPCPPANLKAEKARSYERAFSISDGSTPMPEHYFTTTSNQTNAPPYSPYSKAIRLTLSPTGSISRLALLRWRRQPLFQAVHAAAQADFFSACRSEITRARAAAFGSLHQVARSCFDTATQIRAATTLLEHLSRPEMSAKTPPKQTQANIINNLEHFSPGNGGHPRTFVDKTGVPTDNRSTTSAQRGPY